jgi:hypothetical protein
MEFLVRKLEKTFLGAIDLWWVCPLIRILSRVDAPFFPRRIHPVFIYGSGIPAAKLEAMLTAETGDWKLPHVDLEDRRLPNR